MNLFKKSKKEVSVKVEKLNAETLKNVVGGDDTADAYRVPPSVSGVVIDRTIFKK